MFNNRFFVFLLVLISLIIALTNYSYGTFLSGWDTLHPEFNLNLNLERVISGVFRENQGLGAIAAHAHISELPRILLLYIFNIFLPLSFIRYSYVFLCLIIGPIGLYYFLSKFIVKNKPIAFLGALYYLLNLGTMQQFIVPFEMFTTQYGFLPWIFYSATSYIKNKNNKSLIYFTLIMFASGPMAYASILWYFTFLSLSFYLIALHYREILQKKIRALKQPFLLLFLAILINSYWILPNLYFLIYNAKFVSEANINKIFSEQAFLYNKEFGTFDSILFLKTFYFDWSIYKGVDTFEKLLSPWINHLRNPYVFAIGVFFAITAISGFMASFLNKNKIVLALLPTTLLSVFFLLNENPPFSPIYTFLQNNIPLLKEALRFPGNKVLGLFTFVFSIYIAYMLNLVYVFLSKHKIKAARHLIIITVPFLLVYFMLPGFQGNFISKYVKVKIPNEYFKMFEWFDKQENGGKVANFPVNSFWGWEYYNWYEEKGSSYQGAGFTWFGIKQPLLHRDFDRWGKYNEQYYREISYALYGKDSELFSNVLKKYNIYYLLLDKNIIAPENDSKTLYYKETELLFNKLERKNIIKKVASFGKNISAYEVLQQKPNIHEIINPKNIKPEANNYYEDFLYEKFGNYITSADSASSYYPFLNITNNQSRIDKNIAKLTQNGIEITTKRNIIINPKEILNKENNIPADLIATKTKDGLNFTFYPKLPNNSIQTPLTYNLNLKNYEELVFTVNSKSIFILPKLIEENPLLIGNVFLSTRELSNIFVYSKHSSKKILPDFTKLNYTITTCESPAGNNVFGVEIGKSFNSLNVFAKNTHVCIILPMYQLNDQVNSFGKFLLGINYNYSGNLPSYSCLINLKNGECINVNQKKLIDNNTNYYELDNFNELGLKIYLDSNQSNSMEMVTYEGFNFDIYVPDATASISQDLISRSLLNNNKQITTKLDLPYTGDIQLSQDITKLPKLNISCDQDPFYLNRGFKKEIVKKETEKYIRYKSKDGPACDHFSYKNLSHDQAYFVSITTRNITGLPLFLCILNHTSRRCDVYSPLSKSSGDAFQTDSFLIPPINDAGFGYDISISNLGIKHTEAINDIKSIQIIPFPYNWLSNLSSTDEISQINGQVLTNSQAFNAGWKAYRIQNSKFRIKNFLNAAFPFVFGERLKEHVLVNNWANGWNLDDTSINKLDDSKIIIVFLPQYLEYIGLLLLATTLMLLGVKLKKIIKKIIKKMCRR